MMKLYSFYTPSHAVLKERWFLPSLKDDYEFIIEERPQEVAEGRFMEKGWISTMLHKVDLILRAINENKNRVFIHSDVDVQFFKPTEDIILKAIEGKDMLIQLESRRGTLCPGFFAAIGNDKNLKLWQYIKKELTRQADKNDQDILNEVLLGNVDRLALAIEKVVDIGGGLVNKTRAAFNKKEDHVFFSKAFRGNPFNIKWNYLPLSFFSSGILLDKTWEPGMDFEVPENIILHHANWILGIDNKVAQMKYVKDIIDKRARAETKWV